METCLRIIEWTTQVWGGWYACLIPTDGSTIHERFWEVLERFDPDYLYIYRKTGLDEKLAKPEAYESRICAQIEGYVQQNPGIDAEQVCRHVEEQLSFKQIDSFEISEGLHKVLLRRLNPFFHGIRATQRHVGARSKVSLSTDTCK